MLKPLISVAGAAVVILTGCFGAYLVNRDSIKEHEIRLEYLEKSYEEQKHALEKVAANLAAVERTLAELVGELKHLKKGAIMRKLIMIPVTVTFCAILITGCRTNDITKEEFYSDGQLKKREVDKSYGIVPYSNAVGKSFLNPSFSIVGK